MINTHHQVMVQSVKSKELVIIVKTLLIIKTQISALDRNTMTCKLRLAKLRNWKLTFKLRRFEILNELRLMSPSRGEYWNDDLVSYQKISLQFYIKFIIWNIIWNVIVFFFRCQFNNLICFTGTALLICVKLFVDCISIKWIEMKVVDYTIKWVSEWITWIIWY